ncbi:MAG: hypothetical protein IJS15_12260 [Victivallales bacterium]|nr:hypothetical protein [Victivallales bacterium]
MDDFEPDDNTVAFWDFAYMKKGMIIDQSGFGNDMALKAKEDAPLPRINDDGAEFDGQGGYVELNPKESLRIRKGDFSIEMYIMFTDEVQKPNAVFNYMIIGNKAVSEGKGGFTMGYASHRGNRFYMMYSLDDKPHEFSAKVAKAPEPGKWHKVTFSREGDKMAFFLNGVKLGEETVAGDINLIARRSICFGIYSVPWQRNKQNKLQVFGFKGKLRYVRISDKGRSN